MTDAAAPTENLFGHYAGVASRTIAFVIDAALSFGLYTVGTASATWLIDRVFGTHLNQNTSALWGLAFLGWEFFYFWYCWGASGKTPGAALLGIRVVRQDGQRLGFGRAFIRIVVFPFSFLFFGLGLLGALLGKQRRTWHDIAAHSTVIYDWDARAARLRFLAQRTETSAST
jgi:uncharacterized RDD family membrane protein YckC